MFEANLGQAEPTTAFLGRGPGYSIRFDGDGAPANLVSMSLFIADRVETLVAELLAADARFFGRGFAHAGTQARGR